MGILNSLLGILLIILGFGVLIFVHELGHFFAAKWAGIRTEGFAVGMGPVALSYRKGIGLAFGSTHGAVVKRAGKPAVELTDDELAEQGIGETEYSLRWLPIGGFVKMLGQDDMNPTATSTSMRSYNVAPIGKRMVVVSAGVVMNILLALLLFMIAFMVGVKFEAPIVGDIARELPAGMTMPEDAAELGIVDAGLKPGDVVTAIDGDKTRTFADIQIASAMSRPGTPLDVVVDRPGVAVPLRFTLLPEVDAGSGLLSVGVYPARSTRLLAGPAAPGVTRYLDRVGLVDAGVGPGMILLSVNGQPITTWGELDIHVQSSGGAPLATTWTALDGDELPIGGTVSAPVPVRPAFETLVQPVAGADARDVDYGLLGFGPVTRVRRMLDGSPNAGAVEQGDLVLRAADVDYPRWSQMRAIAADHAGGEFPMILERDGVATTVRAKVDREGRLGIEMEHAEDDSRTAAPISVVLLPGADGGPASEHSTPAAASNLPPGSRIDTIGGTPVEGWRAIRAALCDQTRAARRQSAGASVEMTVTLPVPTAPAETVMLTLDAEQNRRLHELGWSTELDAMLFEPVYTTRKANDPIEAVVMGFMETHKLIMMTYLTIDRLFRGSVGVEQLRGPVGIIDLGAKILPKGFMYFLFFLGMISVNLAVINFLPLPIVDGGLFLFLLYEKFRGRPPSVQFQNIATVVGLCLIGTVFLVTFYNDIARLIS